MVKKTKKNLGWNFGKKKLMIFVWSRRKKCISLWWSYSGSFETFSKFVLETEKINVPISLSPYSDTSAYPLHTWIVLLNLTVYFKAIGENCSKQSVYFSKELLEILRLIFFCVFTKELCGIQIPSWDCGHDDKNNESGC